MSASAQGDDEATLGHTDTLSGASGAATDAEHPGFLSRGSLLGRFVILELLGAGGMGVVHLAYDPELDRRVALKLLHPRRFAAKRIRFEARLQREAQALARLSHPNVVTVYDVVLLDGRLFLAMEWLPGVSLESWLAASPRGRDEVLRVFLDAGRGLAAAHRAGIVHRDFKPGNVLVGDDGRTVVLDFGLARTADPEDRDEAVISFDALAEETEDPAPREALTRPGARLGTPAYMAPEQRRGETAGPAADQYSFCLALAEALEGSGGRPSLRLRRALERGRREDPAARFPTLEPLLREIDRALHRRRRLALGVTAAAVLVLVPAVTVVLWDTAARRQALCAGAAESLHGIWDDARRKSVRAALLATGAPFAKAAWRGTEQALDRYADAWVRQRTEACEATRVRGEQSAELLDRRMACLEQRRQELAAVVDLLARADARLTERATETAQGLPPLAACADASALLAPFREPADPAARQRIGSVRHSLAQAQALEQAGRYAPGLALAREASRQADGIGYWPLTAEALVAQGKLEARAARPEEAAETLSKALLAAEAGRHDRAAVDAFVQLVRVVGYQQARHEEGLRYARHARGLLSHLDQREVLEATLADNEGTLHLHQGKFGAALESYRRALALKLRAFGPESVQVANSLARIGNVLVQQGDFAAALEHQRRALALQEKLLGADHPQVAQSLDTLGTVLFRRAEYGAALPLHRRALAIAERALGAEHDQVATTLTHLGSVYDSLGRADEALACHRRAVAIYEKSLGPGHPNVAFALNNAGAVLVNQGKPAAAVELLRRALSIQQATYGPDHPWTAQAVYSLGEAERLRGRPRQAIPLYRRALDVWQRSLGPRHYLVGYGLTGLGESLLALGRPAEALPDLERAILLFGEQPLDPTLVAEARFAQAQALAALGREPERARRLAGEARDAYAGSGPKGRRKLAEIEAWLTRRPRGS